MHTTVQYTSHVVAKLHYYLQTFQQLFLDLGIKKLLLRKLMIKKCHENGKVCEKSKNSTLIFEGSVSVTTILIFYWLWLKSVWASKIAFWLRKSVTDLDQKITLIFKKVTTRGCFWKRLDLKKLITKVLKVPVDYYHKNHIS